MHEAISLLELNQLIKETLDIQLAPTYWVVAEIAEINHARQGHAYLELVEKEGNQIAAKIRATIWSYTYRSLASRFKSVTGQDLKSGMKILAQVSVTFHEVYGISLNVKEIDPNYTLGERARIRQEIIDRLAREGMLEFNKRFKLPAVPQKIAVISSSTAAGYGDFVNQIKNNRFGYQVHHRLFQATLQGVEAAETIIQALKSVHEAHQKHPFDAIVLIRGGGSQLDLDCFDDYRLAIEIAKSELPVITGIGHERDETIADLVAHTKMKTPTATAEFILSGFREFEDNLELLWKQIERNAAQIWGWEERKLRDLENKLGKLSGTLIHRSGEKLSFILKQIKTLSQKQLTVNKISLENQLVSLQKAGRIRVKMEKEKLERLQTDLGRLNPDRFFEMGYTRSEISGVPVHKMRPKTGDIMSTYSGVMKIESKIEKIEKYGK
ncbi:exodeoxyribonuclease VII large subunit [Cecembia calidifontis]|jgi:exodeoxyribonuclease VII large subunit|uniref:Exodeoxyribonuclease 7 large subunit n=1 Tax=Cecembia calidifontis TaxID=1187080 RepID=A0A4Q7PDL9_9BACT|nr:exodeoxyribonuclease VII large subunit [Cecembia calidifontis]RZS98197.1 exodeoxyribonuclease VII large subunit [Cecembia calidifontis]